MNTLINRWPTHVKFNKLYYFLNQMSNLSMSH